MFCIYKTDPNWIRTLRTLSPDVQVNFWRKGTNALNIPFGSWFYFNERRTRNIVGRGLLVGYEVLTIKAAWEKFGVGNGASSLEELEARALSILNVQDANAEIGCILLSELQFLNFGNEFTINHSDYAPQIVGPKYFDDNQLLEMSEQFSKGFLRPPIAEHKPEGMKLFEGGDVFSYRVGHERNPVARLACLAHHGYACKACGINLEARYGAIAKDFVHVHHLDEIANTDGIREVNPITDLVPLCPNCHAIAHRRSPPFSIAEIQDCISKALINPSSSQF